MKRIAIIAAMPGELKPFVRGWRHERCEGAELWTHRVGDSEWLAACAGAGQQAATHAFAAIEQTGSLDAIVSTGWVGALDDKFLPGRTYRVAGVIDVQTGGAFSAIASDGSPWLATSPRVADEAEKQRLVATYGAGLVDMEAAAIARLAAMRGVPFYAVKGVSDGFRDKLPDFNRFLGAKGEFHLLRLLLFVLPRPWLWPALMRMGENSQKASHSIAQDLLDLLNEQG